MLGSKRLLRYALRTHTNEQTTVCPRSSAHLGIIRKEGFAALSNGFFFLLGHFLPVIRSCCKVPVSFLCCSFLVCSKQKYIVNQARSLYPQYFISILNKKSGVFIFVGISPSSSKERVRDIHKRIMLLNHPDKGGSPYLATKINEAKEYLEKVQTR